MKRRLLASLLTLVMMLSLLPTAALAKNVSDLGGVLTGYIPIGATGTVNDGDRALKYSDTVSYAIAQNDDGTYTLTLSGGAIPSYKTENPVVAKDGTVGDRLTNDTSYPGGYVLDKDGNKHEVPILTEDPYRYSTETGCYYQTLPWYAANDISKVVFEDSVTAIGSNVLDHMPNLTTIEIKNSKCAVSSGAISYYGHLPLKDVVIKASAGVKNLDRMVSAKSDDRDKVNAKVTFSYYEAEDFIQKNASIWTLTKANAEENRTEIEAAYSAYLALLDAAKKQIDETVMPDAQETYGAHMKTLAQSLKTYIPLKLDEQGNTVYSDTVWYTLENGVLTFDGAGELPNYTVASDTSSFMYNATPWWLAREQVKKVVVKSGITSVGALSLAHLNYASEIVIEGKTTKVLSNSISYNWHPPEQAVTIKCWSSNPYVLERIDGYTGYLNDTQRALIHLEYQDVTNFVTTYQDLWTIGENEELTDAQKSEIWTAYATYSESNATFQAGLADVNGVNYAEKLSALNIRAGKQPAEKKYIPIGRDSEGNDICSKTVWYTIEDGVLTFGGEGAIPDYNTQYTETDYLYSALPWYKVKDTITRVVVEKEVTKIGHLALCHMKNLKSVEFLNPNLAFSNGVISYYNNAPKEHVVYHVYAATGFALGAKYFDGWDKYVAGKAEDKISISYYEAENFVKAYNALWTLADADAEGHASEIKMALNALAELPNAAKNQLATDTIPDTSVTYVSKLSQLMADLNLGGKCGENAKYALRDNENGTYTLQITGSGDLYDYTSGNTPWASYSDKITDVTVDSGITKLTNGAFSGLTKLKSVDVPESDLEIEDAAFPNTAFVLYGYSNHASGRYAEAHSNVQLKLKSLRILAMGNSHTVDYTQFVENVLKDIDQDVATKITVERLTPMGGRGLTIDQGDRGNHYNSAHDDTDRTYQSYQNAFKKTWDVVVMQDYHESSSEKYGGAKYATEIQKAVEWLRKDAKGAKIVWFADWAEKSSNGGDLQKTYKLSMEAVKAVQALETNKPDYIIPAATVLQNARTSYLGTVHNPSNVLLNNKKSDGKYVFSDCAVDNMQTYTVLERDTTHMSLELGRQLMATAFVYNLLQDFNQQIIMPEGFDLFAALKTQPEYKNGNCYWLGEMTADNWAIIKEACVNAYRDSHIVTNSTHTTDPFDSKYARVKAVIAQVTLPENLSQETLEAAFKSDDVVNALNEIDGISVTKDSISITYQAVVNGTAENPTGVDGKLMVKVDCHYGYTYPTEPALSKILKANMDPGAEAALKELKQTAINKLNSYMHNDSYAGTYQEQVETAKNNGIAAITAATSEGEVTAALLAAEGVIDKIPTLFETKVVPDANCVARGQIWTGGWDHENGGIEKNYYTMDYTNSTDKKDSTFTGVWWVIRNDSKGGYSLEFCKDPGTGYSFVIPDYNANHWLDTWHVHKSYNPLQYNKTPWFTEYGREITTVVFDDGITVGQYATACLRNVKEYKIGDQVTLNPYVIFFNTLQTNTKITFNNSATVKENAISAYNVQDSYPYYVDVYGNLSKVTTADGTKLEGNLSYAFGEYQEHATAFNTKTGIKEIIATGIDGAPHYTDGVPDGTKMLRVFNVDETHTHTLVTIPAVTSCDYNLSEGSYCSECGAIVTAQVATKGTGSHQWTLTNTVDPAVDKEGYKTYTCSVCHVEKVESIPATAVARIVDPETKEVTNYDKVEDAVKAAAEQVGGSGTADVTVNLVPGYNLPEGTTSSGTTIDKDKGTIKVTSPDATITVPKDVHSFSEEWSYDAANHWHACTVSGHTDKKDEGSHTGGTATCIAKAICEVCGQAYGGFAAHSLTKTEAKAATCTEAGNEAYWTCSTCHKNFSDEQGKNEISNLDAWKADAGKIPVTKHDWSNHDGICKVCKTPCGETHQPGTTCPVCHKYTSYPYVPGAPTYPATAPTAPNGTVTVTPANASKGANVTVTVKPNEGYELGSLAVKDASGNLLPLTDLGNGKFGFVMPASKVSVEAEFVKSAVSTGFADVPANAFFADAVKWAVDKGVTNGQTDTMFGPYEPCTRGQIITFLWRAAGSPEPKTAVSFTDVPAGSYYAKAVAWAIENGITNGMTETTFAPDATCTRGQSVTFLYRALKGSVGATSSFVDVPANAFYADAVGWAVSGKVTDGTSNTTFSPDDNCTRGQIVTFLFRAYSK